MNNENNVKKELNYIQNVFFDSVTELGYLQDILDNPNMRRFQEYCLKQPADWRLEKAQLIIDIVDTQNLNEQQMEEYEQLLSIILSGDIYQREAVLTPTNNTTSSNERAL